MPQWMDRIAFQLRRLPPYLAITLGAACLLVLTRAPLVPEYFAHFDGINFALALEEFNPLLHQPQPPGYPLVVALARLLRPLAGSAETALFTSGVLAGVAACLFVWLLARRMWGPRAAALAVLLLLFHPAFWLAGIRSQARVFLAAAAAAVAYLAWRTMEPRSPHWWFYAAAIVLGLGSGFRPELLPLLLPLVVMAGIWSRRTPAQFALAGLLLALVMAAWLHPLAMSFGGWSQFVFVMRHYAAEQFGGSSLLLGAQPQHGLEMMLATLGWYALGAAPWLWALPVVRPRSGPAGGGRLLAVWGLPCLAFHALVHAGDPEQTLAAAPVLCLAGGWVLAGWRSAARWAAPLAAAAATTIQCGLFFTPPVARTAGYTAVLRGAGDVAAVIRPIKRLEGPSPLFIISYEAAGVWRQVSYYLPDHWLLILHGTLEAPGDPARHMLYRHRRRWPAGLTTRRIQAPAGSRVVFLMPSDEAIPRLLPESTNLKREGPLFYLDPAPGTTLRIGAYDLAVSPPANSSTANTG